MAKIVILSCTKSKTDHRAPAQELYSASPMFKKTLEYGKSLEPDKMFILSAKHHLVPLNKELDLEITVAGPDNNKNFFDSNPDLLEYKKLNKK